MGAVESGFHVHPKQASDLKLLYDSTMTSLESYLKGNISGPSGFCF